MPEKKTEKVEKPDYSTWNITKKMQYAKVLLQESITTKSGKNDYKGFNYMQLQDFMPQLNKIFFELGLFSKFDMKQDIDRESGITKTTAYLTIMNMDEPEGKVLTYSSPVEEAKIQGAAPVQNLGGTQTFLRRYLYLMALDIAVPDVLDDKTGSKKLEEDTGVKKIVPAQITVLQKLCTEEPERAEKMLQFFKVKGIMDLTQQQAVNAITIMRKKKEEPKNEE